MHHVRDTGRREVGIRGEVLGIVYEDLRGGEESVGERTHLRTDPIGHFFYLKSHCLCMAINFLKNLPQTKFLPIFHKNSLFLTSKYESF